MTDAVLTHDATRLSALPGWRVAVLFAGLVAAAFAISWIVPGAWDYPAQAVIPFAEWISAIMLWLKATFTWLTRGLADLINIPLQLAMGFLAKGYRVYLTEGFITLPRFSWVGVCAVAAFVGYRFGGVKLALLSGLSFLAIALFRQWDSAMLTLALILVCVPICVVTGLLLGIWGYLNPRVNKILIMPALDLLQTIPTFAYLIPMLLLFGNSPVSALLATGLFATPPMVRATVLGHVKRGADPTAEDRILAAALGAHAIDVLAAGGRDRMVAWSNREVIDVPLESIVGQSHTVDPMGALVRTARALGICLGDEE